MTNRYIRDTVVASKIEASYGVDSVPTGGANAMQVSNVRITPLNAQYVPRELLRGFFGVDEELIAQYNKLVTYDIEAVGSGTPGTAPAWGPNLRACGWAETITATERVEYTPITNNQESVSQYVWDSGVLHKFLGCRGAASISMALNGLPKINYAFVAIDGGDTTATPSGVSFAAFMQPQAINNQFTGDLTLGGTYVAPGATPAITGGTLYPSTGIEIDTGVRAEYIPLLGAETVEITDRKVKGKIMVAATAAQEVAFYAAIRAGTLQTLSLIHGSVVGRRFGIHGTAVQIKAPEKGDMQGKRMLNYEALFTPVTGNDELTIVTSF